jgi:pyruvate kinase
MAIDVDAKGIVVSSVSGKTAMMVSRFRCPVPIIGMTTDRKVWRKLALSWGVYPAMSDEFMSMDVMFYHALAGAKRFLHLQKGDRVVLTGGPINGKSGNTNTIKVEEIN